MNISIENKCLHLQGEVKNMMADSREEIREEPKKEEPWRQVRVKTYWCIDWCHC